MNAQDSLSSDKQLFKFKVGIYKTESEFLHNSPSILAPFSYKPIKGYSSKGEIVLLTYSYWFNDFSEEIGNVYGFCDGKETYVRAKEYEKIIDRHHTFFRVDRIGKYPFFTVLYNNKNYTTFSTNLTSAFINQAMNNLEEEKVKLYYFDSKGRWLVTRKEMLYLLKSQLDLLNEFKREKEFNYKTLKKYLIMINERNPT